MRECYFCKKQYEGYPVIMCSLIECFAFEQHIKDIYYFDKDEGHEKDIGVCKSCRDVHINKNNIFKWRANFHMQLQMELLIIEMIKQKKERKTYEEALKRLKVREKELEKTKEVRAERLKNAPHLFKTKPRKKTKCYYCGENNGQQWIDDPNEGDKPTLKNCWWVCIPCSKIIQKQQEMDFLEVVGDRMQDLTGKPPPKKAQERVKQLQKEIDDISYEDGQKTFTVKIKRKKDDNNR